MELGIESILGEVLEDHGVTPAQKGEGVTRLMTGNPSGFSRTISGNKKLEKEKEVIEDLEADVVAFLERKIHCRHKLNHSGFR